MDGSGIFSKTIDQELKGAVSRTLSGLTWQVYQTQVQVTIFLKFTLK